ncbi:MAG: hypothetical protein WCD18_09255 [Thermosynechococcaceae cyanobacterium]
MLSYKIKVLFASSLSGKKVVDLADIIGLNYTVTENNDGWYNDVSSVRQKWIWKGHISGICSTEEIGTRNLSLDFGGALSIRITFRYLHFWETQSVSPESGRVYFFGCDHGKYNSSINNSIHILKSFLRRVKIQELNNSFIIKQPNNFE